MRNRSFKRRQSDALRPADRSISRGWRGGVRRYVRQTRPLNVHTIPAQYYKFTDKKSGLGLSRRRASVCGLSQVYPACFIGRHEYRELHLLISLNR
jgi:hypothetical protein